jgi:hypothetical protein
MQLATAAAAASKPKWLHNFAMIPCSAPTLSDAAQDTTQPSQKLSKRRS